MDQNAVLQNSGHHSERDHQTGTKAATGAAEGISLYHGIRLVVLTFHCSFCLIEKFR